MTNPFLADALAMGDELIAVRRDLHMHPELGFQAETAVMRGTIRCFSQEVRKVLHERVRAVAEGVAAALGARAVNTTGGEDFSAVLERVPSNFFMLGARNDAAGKNFPHHNPRFDIDGSCLPYGAAILSEAAARCLRGEAD